MSDDAVSSVVFTNVGRERWYRRGALASQTAYVAVALLVITALVAVFANHFLTANNLLNTSKNFSYIAIVARAASTCRSAPSWRWWRC